MYYLGKTIILKKRKYYKSQYLFFIIYIGTDPYFNEKIHYCNFNFPKKVIYKNKFEMQIILKI